MSIVELEKRLADLRNDLADTQAALLNADERAVTSIANGGDAASEIKEVAEAQVRQATLKKAITRVEKELKENRDTDLLERAKARLLQAIPRADGSLASEYEEDVARLAARAEDLLSALSTLNDRYRARELLRFEAHALAARFSLHGPTLVSLIAPLHLETAGKALFKVQTSGLHDYFRPSPREARRLVSATTGGQLVAEAGPSETERKEAEDRERVAEDRAARAAQKAASFAPLQQQIEAMKHLPISRF